RRVGADATRRVVGVEHRQLDIHQDEIGMMRRRHADAAFSVRGLDQLEAGTGEEIAQDAPVVLGILDHQDAFHCGCLCSVTRTGTRMRNVEPVPRTESTVIVPPCISTKRRAMARPRPVPPLWRGLVLSTCWKSSKMRI